MGTEKCDRFAVLCFCFCLVGGRGGRWKEGRDHLRSFGPLCHALCIPLTPWLRLVHFESSDSSGNFNFCFTFVG